MGISSLKIQLRGEAIHTKIQAKQPAQIILPNIGSLIKVTSQKELVTSSMFSSGSLIKYRLPQNEFTGDRMEFLKTEP